MTNDGPPHSRAAPPKAFVDSSLLGVAISLPIVASICVVLRFCARRWKSGTGWHGDDWTILITLLFCWGHSINTIIAGGIGGVNTIIMPPREYANMALRTLWIATFLLITSLYTVKISILLFYWNLFHVHDKFRKTCVGMMVVLTLWWISSLICAFLSTDPISSAWKDAAHARHRFDFNMWYISYSGLSILFDVVILCLPISVVKALRVNTKRKLSIISIFWLGGFVCISAIIRFALFYTEGRRLKDFGSTDQYSSITQAFIWSEIEPNTSVIAACLPTYGPFFREGGIFPRLIGSVKSTFGKSSGETNQSRLAARGKIPAVGYYELDKMVSSQKSTGDILTEPVTTHSGSTASRKGEKGYRDSTDADVV